MATLPGLYDDEFDQAVIAVWAVETTAFASTGRYHQLNNLAEAGLSDPVDVVVRVDVYQAPAGHGYVVVGRATVSGVNYLRSQNVGPESSRTHGWVEVSEGGI